VRLLGIAVSFLQTNRWHKSSTASQYSASLGRLVNKLWSRFTRVSSFLALSTQKAMSRWYPGG
jgi:hypothetical protein